MTKMIIFQSVTKKLPNTVMLQCRKYISPVIKDDDAF